MGTIGEIDRGTGSYYYYFQIYYDSVLNHEGSRDGVSVNSQNNTPSRFSSTSLEKTYI